MNSGVYWIYQISKDIAVYVGSSINLHRRLLKHRAQLKRNRHENSHLQRTWDKYGESDFTISTLEETPADKLVEREQFWMDALDPVCNISVAAYSINTGRHLDQATKEKIGAAHRGKVLSEEHRKKLSLAKLGKPRGPMSQATKDKIGNANRGRVSAKLRKSRSPMSQVAKDKIGAANRHPWNAKRRLAYEKSKV